MNERMLEELSLVVENCRENNWDGNGAKSLNIASIQECMSFINWLPLEIEDFEITPYPSSYIGIDIRNGKNLSHIVFQDDYYIWCRNEGKKVTSGRILNSNYFVKFVVLGELMRIFVP